MLLQELMIGNHNFTKITINVVGPRLRLCKELPLLESRILTPQVLGMIVLYALFKVDSLIRTNRKQPIKWVKDNKCSIILQV